MCTIGGRLVGMRDRRSSRAFHVDSSHWMTAFDAGFHDWRFTSRVIAFSVDIHSVVDGLDAILVQQGGINGLVEYGSFSLQRLARRSVFVVQIVRYIGVGLALAAGTRSLRCLLLRRIDFTRLVVDASALYDTEKVSYKSKKQETRAPQAK